MWSLWSLALGAGPVVTHESANTGPLKHRMSDVEADVVLLYGGEQNASMTTCGCPGDPRGGLGRLVAVERAVRGGEAPVLSLNPGNWLRDTAGADGALRADVRVANDAMMDAATETWGVANAGFRDLPHLQLAEEVPPGVVSANAEGSGLPAFRIIELSDRRIAVTGVTGWAKTHQLAEAIEPLDPLESLEALLPTLRAQSDLVVVLGYGLGRQAKPIAQLDIDVLIEADAFESREVPIVVGNTVWVRSRHETRSVGELRIVLGPQGIERAVDRSIALDDAIRVPRDWRRRVKAVQADVSAAQEALFGPL